jgi:hypothetical protein
VIPALILVLRLWLLCQVSNRAVSRCSAGLTADNPLSGPSLGLSAKARLCCSVRKVKITREGKDGVVSVWDMEHGYWVVGLKVFWPHCKSLTSHSGGEEVGRSVRTEHYVLRMQLSHPQWSIRISVSVSVSIIVMPGTAPSLLV